jgi:hypothetical protein
MNTAFMNTNSKLYSVLSWHALPSLSKPYLSAHKYSYLKPHNCVSYDNNVMEPLSGSCWNII